MKTIKTQDGQIIHGYEFNDLSPEIQDKILAEQIQFEIEVMDEDSPYYSLAEKMDEMQTPWFLGAEIYNKHKKDLIETIEINGYLFDDSGDILPIVEYTGKHPKAGTFGYGKKEIPCTIE